MSLVFVYGTLKRGDVRARALAGERFVDVAVTQTRYRMFNTGTFPALVEVAANGLAIEGEVYDVSADGLRRLDDVEGVEEQLYTRRAIQLAAPFDRAPVDAYFYVPSVAGMPDCGVRWERQSGARDVL
jgi:gamma-glutamylaminecyclotransferase